MKLVLQIKKLYKNPNLFLPVIYLSVVLVGLALFIFARLFPKFDISGCIVLGGQMVCTLVGIYIATFVSLPGYVFLGSILSLLKLEFPVALSYLLLLLTNLGIYMTVGFVLQKLVSSRSDTNKFITNLIITILIMLMVILLLLTML